MKIGITLGLLAPKYWNDVAIEADKLGFYSLWMPDHLVFPTNMSGSPFSENEHPPIPPSTKLFDAFAYLGFLAAKTENIRLGTNVYLLGLRHPFVAARAIATLDYLSNGRADIGVGAGWLRQEWEVAGFDPKTRGKRLDEALEVCKRLWTEETIKHQGQFYQFDEVMFEPKPVQNPHPPILVGGESPAALRRVAKHGDGWYGIGHTVESVQPVIKKLRSIVSDEGRDPDTLQYITVGEIKHADDIKRWEESGITQLVVTPWKRGKEALAGLNDFAEMAF